MRLPRFSIAGLMALTALMALDCLAVRAAWHSNEIRVILLFFVGLPWLNVLVLGLATLRKRWRSREPLAFLVGFMVVGWLLLALDVVVILDRGSDLEAPFNALTAPLDPLVELVFPAGLAIALGIVMAVATLPQLIVAIVGGALNRRYRLRVERREPAQAAP